MDGEYDSMIVSLAKVEVGCASELNGCCSAGRMKGWVSRLGGRWGESESD